MAKILAHRYAAFRRITFEGMSRQRFRLLCRRLQKSIPDYYDGLSGDRTICIKVARYIPQEDTEEHLKHARAYNEALADNIIETYAKMLKDEADRNI